MERCENIWEDNRCRAYELMQDGEDILIIDIRTPREYEEVHIQHSVLIPCLCINICQIQCYLSKSIKGVFIYCRSGHGSEQAVMQLKQAGYQNIYNIGSLYDWKWKLVGSMVGGK